MVNETEEERDVYDEAVKGEERRLNEEKEKAKKDRERQDYISEQRKREREIKLRFPELIDNKNIPEGEISLKFLPVSSYNAAIEKDQWEVKCEIIKKKDPSRKFNTFEEADPYFRLILTKHREKITAARNAWLENKITENEGTKRREEKYSKNEKTRARRLQIGLILYLIISLLIAVLIAVLCLFKPIWLLILIMIVLDLVISAWIYYDETGIKRQLEESKKDLNEVLKIDDEIIRIRKQKEQPLL